MFVLGLTGSIGMGKSTVATMFADAGIPVHDADATVHRLYRGEAVAAVEAAFPGTTAGGEVDRVRLAEQVYNDPAALARLEAVIHPLVRAAEMRFLRTAVEIGAHIVVFDIPLLFETGAQERVDAVVVVSAPADVQRARVLKRENMTPARFDAILARQMSDAEKRRRAHFVVDSSRDFDSARAQVHGILRAVAARPGRHRDNVGQQAQTRARDRA